MAIGQIKIIYTYLQVEINILQHALDNSFKGERRKVMVRGIPDWVVDLVHRCRFASQSPR